MLNKSSLLLAAAVVAISAGAANADPYDQNRQNNDQSRYSDQNRPNSYDSRNQSQADYANGYRAGYKAGYDAGRRRARYDDRLSQFNDPNDRWRHRYSRSYTYNDDGYYRDCRNSPDPGGVLAGAIIGGLLGSSVSHGRTGPTVAGVIIGGTLGAGLTSHMNCEDRSYAYRTYYDGFNSGRPNTDYQWDNPDSNNYGDFRVGRYYTDPDGFRCATYTQQIYVDGRRESDEGYACQQPDGTWAIVG